MSERCQRIEPCPDAAGTRRAAGRRRRRLAPCLAALLLVLARPALALDPNRALHNYVRDSWSTERGLPQVAVTAISQDAEGYLWVGTLSGLARFDGVRFESFQPATTPALPSGLVQALRSDSAGQLWIATSKGLAVRREGRFETVPTANPDGPETLDVQDVLPTAGGDVLATSTTGLYRVAGGKLELERAVPGPLYAAVEQAGTRWFGGWGGVYRLEQGQARFEALPGLGLRDIVRQLVPGQDRVTGQPLLWAGTTAGLFLREQGRWRRYDGDALLATAAITLLQQDRDGNLWVGDANGLSRIQGLRLSGRAEIEASGARWDYLSAFEDRDGNFWLGSRSRGLTRLWNGISTRYSVPEGLNTPQVWTLGRDPAGRLWVGTDNGLSLFENGRFQLIASGRELPDPNVYSLLAEADQVWIGTLRGAALWHRGALERPPALAPLAELHINSLLRDRRGQLWLATSGGLYRLADGRLQHIAPATAEPEALRVLLETRDGRVLAGGPRGLAEVAPDADRLRPLTDGLPPDLDVTAVTELADGRLLVGEASGALLIGGAAGWQRLRTAPPLSSPTAFGASDAGGDRLWIASLSGVVQIALAALGAPDLAGATDKDEVRTLAASPVLGELGLRETGSRGECCSGIGGGRGLWSEGRFWLPTRDGVLALDRVPAASPAVPLRIESVSAADGWSSAVQGTTLTPPGHRRDLRIRFSALDYRQPYALPIEYRLEGIDRDWQTLAQPLQREIRYDALPAGEYRFELRLAGAADGPAASLALRLPPRFAETGLARALTVAVLLGLAALLWWLLLRLRARRRRKLESLIAEHTGALASANRQLEMASSTDPLTGLRNRRYLGNQLPQDLSFYRRSAPDAFTDEQVLLFVLIDIDHFKAINDRYGHATGDRVLQEVSALLVKLVRTGDYVTRWGGEEFLIVSRPLSRIYARAYAARICRMVAQQRFDAGPDGRFGGGLEVTCSIGFAEYPLRRPPPGLDWQDLVELADAAMYHVKAAGRNGWACFDLGSMPASPAVLARAKQDSAGLVAEGRLRIVSSFNTAGDITPFEDGGARSSDAERSG